MPTIGNRVIESEYNTDHAVVLTPGFSEWTHSHESLARSFADTGYDAHLVPPRGQEDREQPFYDLEGDADVFADYIGELRSSYEWVAGFGNSLGAITQGLTESQNPGVFDALIATTVPPTVETFIPSVGINALDYTPDSVLRNGADLAHHLLNATQRQYRERTGRLRHLTKREGETQFGATRFESSGGLAKRLREAPETGELLRGGDSPVLFAYGGDDTVHTGSSGMSHTGDLPGPVQSMIDMVGQGDRDVYGYVLSGADHGFNASTGIDDDFNGDPGYHSIRNVFTNYLAEHGGIKDTC